MARPDGSPEPIGDAREPRAVRWSAALQLIPLAVVIVLLTAGLDPDLTISRIAFLVSALPMAVLVWALRPAFSEPAGRRAMIATTVGLAGAVAGIVVAVLALVGGATELIGAGSSAAQGIWLMSLGVYGTHLPVAILRLAIAGGAGLLLLAVAPSWGGTPIEIVFTVTASVLTLAVFALFFGLTSPHRWTGRRSIPDRAAT